MAASSKVGASEAAAAESGWLRPALGIVAAVTLLRWLLLAFDHTDLYVDEAQYWLWGQEFAFGYYSKPPLIAWLIGVVTTLAGSDSTFWVRMPGAALHGATALILAALTARIYGNRHAVLVAATYVSLPMAALGSLLISTDTVMAPFFAAALYFRHRLIETRSPRFAALAGAAIGVAFMAKYAAVYFLIGVALAAVLRRDQRISAANTAWMLLAFAAVISPNVGWNLQHQFTTLSHTVDNVGWVRQTNPLAALDLLSLAEFFFSQFAVAGPMIFAALLITLRQPRQAPALAAFVLPPLIVVCLQSLLGTAQANWAVAAYFAGTVLAISVLANHPRWLTASFLINGAICLILPLIAIFPRLSLDGQKPLIDRQLGRAAISQQLIALSQASGNVPIMANSRDILADLFYTGRDANLSLYAPRPKGRPANHYQQRYPRPVGLTGQILVVSNTAPTCPAQPFALDARGGAYAKWKLSAYLVDASCLDAQ
jgi:4-amino-4-deoxy-L-arabinose transferase-like glycosyltransferase